MYGDTKYGTISSLAPMTIYVHNSALLPTLSLLSEFNQKLVKKGQLTYLTETSRPKQW